MVPVIFQIKLFKPKKRGHRNSGSKETGYMSFSGDLLPILNYILLVTISVHM